MSDSFCVLYRESLQGQSRLRLSAIYDSLELALTAALNLSAKNATLLEVRGADGTVIRRPKLDSLLTRLTDSASEHLAQ